ncbi:protein of unknown function [Georgfuchsia toluolica]|uniref:Uncharacterized protein n=1 Tax=Georgfuchsia toluolica TaxID=424218 RepID=A0A916N1T5_9PROT|nr:hypothetical protein [Georgfuchsia toluolica]CAG4883029.1 protein of unknown function [Georgfuchsia toluolica]
MFIVQPIPAGRLERMGIVNHVAPAIEIEAFIYAMARTIARNSPLSVPVMKEQLRIPAGAPSMSSSTSGA